MGADCWRTSQQVNRLALVFLAVHRTEGIDVVSHVGARLGLCLQRLQNLVSHWQTCFLRFRSSGIRRPVAGSQALTASRAYLAERVAKKAARIAKRKEANKC